MIATIFDIDGTLVESFGFDDACYVSAIREVLGEVYIHDDWSKYKNVTDKRLISFDNPDQFEPDETVYIYFVDLAKISDDKKIYIDPWQIAVTEDEITPDKVETYKAGDLFNYYRLVDKWD